MNSKQPCSMRPMGQRSIPSTFLFRSTNRFTDCKKSAKIKASNEKGSAVSLSEFLNRKLHRNSVLPGSVQRKQRPFLSSMDNEDVNCAKEEIFGKAREEAEKDFALDVVLKQFRDAEKEKVNVCSSAYNVLGSATKDDEQESRKRIRGAGKEFSKKIVAVLGDDSETRRRKKGKSLAINETPIPLFNHYASGGGWWDCNMEGIDNEEVGCTDVWEGMGSAALGGLEWH